ncbi:MAG TPA: hypothetical protein PKH07_19770, partial [bacterium]|nr:hypothetical protein [bacterium]
MSDIKLACPDCKQHIAAPEEMAGQSVNCPTCNKILQIPERSTVIPVSQNPMPLSDVAPSGSPQTAPTTDAGVGDTRKNQVATNLTEMAKTTIGAAQHLADQGTSIAKNKWKDVGGTEGVKQKAKTYVEAVKHGFAPDEGAKGVGQVTSRVKNLWRSSKYGKVTIIAASLILCWLLFGG